MIEKRRPDVLTLSTTFYDFSVSRNLFLMVETRQFGASGNQRIWHCREQVKFDKLKIEVQVWEDVSWEQIDRKEM